MAGVGSQAPDPAGEPGVAPGGRAGRAVLIYNLWRLVLLACCLGIGFLAGLRGFVLIVVALFVSGVLSWFVLGRQRVNMGVAIERTVERGRARMAARTAAEDAVADEIARRAADDQPSR